MLLPSVFRRIVTLAARFARDKAGNALMLTAAAMIPLTGMVGGAVDLSRLYLVKVRLQHACDAGALAGRKAMGGGAWGTDDLTSANQFFDDNFVNGAYGTGTVTRTFTQPNGSTAVHGVASTTVPMTLMRVFSIPTQTVAVSCDSDMQMPNTDVMFVLDNTGSMMFDPDNKNCCNGSTSKIVNLKNAVKCFYEVLAQKKSNGTCTTTISGTGIPATTQLRFGFVPYSTNVNVSRLVNGSTPSLDTRYFAMTWPYQSRMPRWWVQTSQESSSKTLSVPNAPQNYCNDDGARQAGYEKDPEDSYTTDNTNHNNTWTHTTTDVSGYKYSGNTCSGTQTITKTTYKEVEKATPGPNDIFAEWHYGKITHALTGFKNGSTLSGSVTLPVGKDGATTSLSWNGCSEELAATTDINTVGDAQLGPVLTGAVYLRAITSKTDQATVDDRYTSDNYNGVSATCPTAARPLQTWSTSDFNSYVDSLSAAGNTYHDVGMLWGGRLLSPEGIFASTNAATPSGGQIQRHLIFMTDGDAQANPCDYSQFGVAWWDRRTNSNVGPASQCGQESGTLDNDINTRLAALCTAVKAEPNTILWVISYGGNGIAADTKARLQKCATDDSHYFDATNNASLASAFQEIASKIAQLRITG